MTGGLVVLMAVAGTLLPGNVGTAQAADYTCYADTEAALVSCLALGGTGDSIDIMITASVSLTISRYIDDGKTVSITSSDPATYQLNVATSGMSNQVIITDGATLVLTDIIANGAPGNGNAMFLVDGATIDIDPGAILQGHARSSGCGAAVEASNGSSVNIDGGSLLNNNGLAGGGVCLESGSVLTMTDGTISGNTNGFAGGAVSLEGGSTFNMEGGTITSNTAAYGGAISSGMISNGTLDNTVNTVNISGGTISDNTTASTSGYGNGGGYYGAPGSVLTVSGDAVISDNSALNTSLLDTFGNGGGIYMIGTAALPSTLSITGGTITGNSTAAYAGSNDLFATGAGGGIYIGKNVTAAISGSTITGNAAQGNGGGIYSVTDLTIAGSTITGNAAQGNGGGIYMDSTTEMDGNYNINNFPILGYIPTLSLDISGASNISQNTAGADGGGVWVAYDELVDLTVGANVVFSDNSAATEAPERVPADDAVYAANILSNSWTAPLTQGYNNYDIAYRAPTVTFGVTGALADPAAQAVGDLIVWTYTITNTSIYIMWELGLSPDPGLLAPSAIVCGDGSVPLGEIQLAAAGQAGDTITCTNTSEIQQADIDNAAALNDATFSGAAIIAGTPDTYPGMDGTNARTVPVTAEATGQAPLTQNPKVEIVKTAEQLTDDNGNGLADVGDQVVFTITLTNQGNVTINNLRVDDSMDGLTLTCADQTSGQTVKNGQISLAPGAVVICTTSAYTIGAADAAAGEIVNQATFSSDVGNPLPPGVSRGADEPATLAGGNKITLPVAEPQTPQTQTPQAQTPQAQTPQAQTPQAQTPQIQTGGMTAGLSPWVAGLAGVVLVLAGGCLLIRRFRAGEAG